MVEILPQLIIYNESDATLKNIYFHLDKCKKDVLVKKTKAKHSSVVAIPTYAKGNSKLTLYYFKDEDKNERIEQVVTEEAFTAPSQLLKVYIYGINEDGSFDLSFKSEPRY